MTILLPLALSAACALSPSPSRSSVPSVSSVVSTRSAHTELTTTTPAGIPDTTYRRLFEGGVTMDAFLAAARSRKAQWASNYERGVVADAVLTRARAVPGPWKLLVVAVDGCSDSVNTIPYVARLAEQLPGVELRIIDNKVGREVMDAHRTPDGRGATPTVILLDANYEERGCWVERPAELRDWMLENKGKLKDSELFEHKMAWYDEDAGAKTLLDIAAMFEGAGRGASKC